MMSKKEKKQLITRKNYQEYLQNETKKKEEKDTKVNLRSEKNKVNTEEQKTEKKKTKNTAKTRLTVKEKGRRLDRFYNWSIIIVLVAIVLVFVLAFVI